jgi:hypothetical protein
MLMGIFAPRCSLSRSETYLAVTGVLCASSARSAARIRYWSDRSFGLTAVISVDRSVIETASRTRLRARKRGSYGIGRGTPLTAISFLHLSNGNVNGTFVGVSQGTNENGSKSRARQGVYAPRELLPDTLPANHG